ncbi:hypothetical protein HZ326_27640 [Fusarium oxysporum f. sp. albedinis]|nr:hypothetical protein HZ326_27640 [Fusarium oxysporum f. sp. albedinis]
MHAEIPQLLSISPNVAASCHRLVPPRISIMPDGQMLINFSFWLLNGYKYASLPFVSNTRSCRSICSANLPSLLRRVIPRYNDPGGASLSKAYQGAISTSYISYRE